MRRPDGVNALLALTGCDAFTLLLFDPGEGVARRVFSSRPKEFPAAGTKLLAGTVWAEQLLTHRTPLVSDGPEALKRNFDDHELIISLGIKAIINIPILRLGKCVGGVNCLYFSRPDLSVDQAITDQASLLADEIIGLER